ncbi:MAG: aminodeoxychorismate/anthranilate synthase component II [Bacteroidetes bacterium]|nr:aminodeoxychorismate/anthranilate synthase component II [Bacteroidota bacterium]
MKFLLLDNYDSFTYMLRDYLEQCGAECVVFRNDEESLLLQQACDYDALVISPGPSTPADAGFMMLILQRFSSQLPILGICLGHQAIGELFGAKLVHAKLPRHGKTDTMSHSGDRMFEGIHDSFQATRYHSLKLIDLPEVLVQTASCEGEVMAIKHKYLPIWGVQFHPESCQTPDGLQILKNFSDLVKSLAGNKK